MQNIKGRSTGLLSNETPKLRPKETPSSEPKLKESPSIFEKKLPPPNPFAEIRQKLESPQNIDLKSLEKLRNQAKETYQNTKFGLLESKKSSPKTSEYNRIDKTLEQRIRDRTSPDKVIERLRNHIELSPNDAKYLKESFQNLRFMEDVQKYLDTVSHAGTFSELDEAFVTLLNESSEHLASNMAPLANEVMAILGRVKSETVEKLENAEKGVGEIKNALGISHFPTENMEKTLQTVLRDPTVFKAYEEFYKGIGNKSVDDEEKVIRLAQLEQAIYSVALQDNPPLPANQIMEASRVFRPLLESYGSTLGNVQFHTDSISSLIYDQNTAPQGTLSRWFKGGLEDWGQLSEPKQGYSENAFKAFQSQLAIARQRSEEIGLPKNSRWDIPQGSMNSLTHAGWIDTSAPQPGDDPKVLKGTRTLGLMRGKEVALAKVPLDFSALGPISHEKAKTLMNITENVSKEAVKRTNTPVQTIAEEFLNEAVKNKALSQDDKEKALPEIVNFVKGSTEGIDNIVIKTQMK